VTTGRRPDPRQIIEAHARRIAQRAGTEADPKRSATSAARKRPTHPLPRSTHVDEMCRARLPVNLQTPVTPTTGTVQEDNSVAQGLRVS